MLVSVGFVVGGCASRRAERSPADDGQVSTGAPGEITVQRINVVDAEGRLAVVIAAAPDLPGVIRDGTQAGMRAGVPGLLFYNNQGDEIGGLIFPTRVGENGLRDGGVSLSFDQADHGQAIHLMHWATGAFVRSALRINDFPTDIPSTQVEASAARREALQALQGATSDEEAQRLYKAYLRLMGDNRFYAERVYLGSEGSERRAAMLELKDSRSRPRIRLIVDENDTPRIEILNPQGEVVRSIEGEERGGP